MGLENTNTIAIIRQTKHHTTYLRWGVLGVGRLTKKCAVYKSIAR